jgi:hypothetical protein
MPHSGCTVRKLQHRPAGLPVYHSTAPCLLRRTRFAAIELSTQDQRKEANFEMINITAHRLSFSIPHFGSQIRVHHFPPPISSVSHTYVTRDKIPVCVSPATAHTAFWTYGKPPSCVLGLGDRCEWAIGWRWRPVAVHVCSPALLPNRSASLPVGSEDLDLGWIIDVRLLHHGHWLLKQEKMQQRYVPDLFLEHCRSRWPFPSVGC